MKNFYLTLLALILSDSAIAQASEAKINWSKSIEAEYSDVSKVMRSTKDAFYFVNADFKGMQNLDKLYVSLVDFKTLEPIFEIIQEDVDFQGNKVWLQEYSVRPNGDAVFYFFCRDKKENTNYFLSRVLTTAGQLSDYKVLTSHSSKLLISGSVMAVKVSKNESKVLVTTTKASDVKITREVIMMNQDHEVLWKREISLPYSYKDFNILDFEPSNNGDVFVFGFTETVKSKDNEKFRGRSTEKYSLFKFTESKKRPQELKLPLNKVFVNQPKLSLDLESNKLLVHGFYTKDRKNGKKSTIEGAFTLAYNQDSLTSPSSSFAKFSPEVLRNFMSDKNVNEDKDLPNLFRSEIEFFQNNAILSNTFVREIEVLENSQGEAYLLSEYYYTSSSSSQNSSGTDYHFNEILITKLGKNGEVIWNTIVPKSQGTNNRANLDFCSFYAEVFNDDLFIFFNESEGNLQRRIEEKSLRNLIKRANLTTIQVKVNDQGELSYNELLRAGQDEYFTPHKSIKVGDNRALLFRQNRNDVLFGSVQFR